MIGQFLLDVDRRVSARSEIERRNRALHEGQEYKNIIRVFLHIVDFFSRMGDTTPLKQRHLFERMAASESKEIFTYEKNSGGELADRCMRLFLSLIFGELKEQQTSELLLGETYEKCEAVRELQESRRFYEKTWDHFLNDRLATSPREEGSFSGSEEVEIYRDIVTRELTKLMRKLRERRKVEILLYRPEQGKQNGKSEPPAWTKYTIAASCSFDYTYATKVAKRRDFNPTATVRLELSLTRGEEIGEASILMHSSEETLIIDAFSIVVRGKGDRETKEATETAAYHLLAEILLQRGDSIKELYLSDQRDVESEDLLAERSLFTPPLDVDPYLIGIKLAHRWKLTREKALVLTQNSPSLLDIEKVMNRRPLKMRLVVVNERREYSADVEIARRGKGLIVNALQFSPKLPPSQERISTESGPTPVEESLYFALAELLLQVEEGEELLLPHSDALEIEGSSAAAMLGVETPIIVEDGARRALAWRLSKERAEELTKELPLPAKGTGKFVFF